jgi:hypothetical protein
MSSLSKKPITEVAAWAARVDAFSDAQSRLLAGQMLLATALHDTPWQEQGIRTILKHVDAPDLTFSQRIAAINWALPYTPPGSAVEQEVKSKRDELKNTEAPDVPATRPLKQVRADAPPVAPT